jgi:outer membrane biosynthesis protein TonB
MTNQLRNNGRNTTARVIAAFVCMTNVALCQAPQPRPSATRIVGMEYPGAARLAFLQGAVDLVATISPDGTVGEIRVLSGPPLLATPAKETLSKWRFAGRAAPAGQCEAKFVFSFVLLPGTCNSGSHCPSEFQVDLPDSVRVSAQPFNAIPN